MNTKSKSKYSKKTSKVVYSCSPNTCIETSKGEVFKCNGWGKGWMKVKPYEKENYCVIRDYVDTLSFIQINTDNNPKTFVVGKEEIIKALTENKIKYYNT